MPLMRFILLGKHPRRLPEKTQYWGFTNQYVCGGHSTDPWAHPLRSCTTGRRVRGPGFSISSPSSDSNVQPGLGTTKAPPLPPAAALNSISEVIGENEPFDQGQQTLLQRARWQIPWAARLSAPLPPNKSWVTTQRADVAEVQHPSTQSQLVIFTCHKIGFF